MKQLNEYETPENDRLSASMLGRNPTENIMAHVAFSYDLERRLAACRDLLACINSTQCLDWHIHTAISETLILTSLKQ